MLHLRFLFFLISVIALWGTFTVNESEQTAGIKRASQDLLFDAFLTIFPGEVYQPSSRNLLSPQMTTLRQYYQSLLSTVDDICALTLDELRSDSENFYSSTWEEVTVMENRIQQLTLGSTHASKSAFNVTYYDASLNSLYPFAPNKLHCAFSSHAFVSGDVALRNVMRSSIVRTGTLAAISPSAAPGLIMLYIKPEGVGDALLVLSYEPVNSSYGTLTVSLRRLLNSDTAFVSSETLLKPFGQFCNRPFSTYGLEASMVVLPSSNDKYSLVAYVATTTNPIAYSGRVAILKVTSNSVSIVNEIQFTSGQVAGIGLMCLTSTRCVVTYSVANAEAVVLSISYPPSPGEPTVTAGTAHVTSGYYLRSVLLRLTSSTFIYSYHISTSSVRHRYCSLSGNTLTIRAEMNAGNILGSPLLNMIVPLQLPQTAVDFMARVVVAYVMSFSTCRIEFRVLDVLSATELSFGPVFIYSNDVGCEHRHSMLAINSNVIAVSVYPVEGNKPHLLYLSVHPFTRVISITNAMWEYTGPSQVVAGSNLQYLPSGKLAIAHRVSSELLISIINLRPRVMGVCNQCTYPTTNVTLSGTVSSDLFNFEPGLPVYCDAVNGDITQEVLGPYLGKAVSPTTLTLFHP